MKLARFTIPFEVLRPFSESFKNAKAINLMGRNQ
jgi:hypothetical protein